MTDRRISSHWPDYFRLDWAVGTDSAAPLAQALDATSLAVSEESLSAAYAVRPALWSIESCRRAVSALGFPDAMLSDLEVRALYAARADLLARRGTLGALRRLAGVYLGVAEVRRGAATGAMPLPAAGAERLIVADLPSEATTIVVRTAVVVDAERVNAFQEACACLAGDDTRIRVYPPRREVAPENRGYATAQPQPLVERRI